MTALAEFAAGAGHEINNPLAIISGHAQILLNKTDSPEDRRHLSVIIAQTRRAYEMIADIRLFARPPRPVPERFRFRDFFDTFREETLQNYPEWKGRISLDPESESTADSLFLTTDRSMIRSIFDALTKNVIEAVGSGKNRRIVLSVRRMDGTEEDLAKTGGELPSDRNEGEEDVPATPSEEDANRSEEKKATAKIRFIFSDNGPDVPTEIRDRIFSPYFSGRLHGRGLGFGLPRSWAFARVMGGDLYLDRSEREAPDVPSPGPSAPEKMTRFVLEIPENPPTAPTRDY